MGLCGVRADMMRNAWKGGAECVEGGVEPMRRACGAYRQGRD